MQRKNLIRSLLVLVACGVLTNGCVILGEERPAEIDAALGDASCEGLRMAQEEVCPDEPSCEVVEALLEERGCVEEELAGDSCLCPEGASLHYYAFGGLYCAAPDLPGGRLSFRSFEGEATCEAFGASPAEAYDISDCADCCEVMFPATVNTADGPVEVASCDELF